MIPVCTAGLFLLAATIGGVLPVSTSLGETIRLREGFQHILDVPDSRRLAIGDPNIVEARPLPRRDGILVVGKKEGVTSLVVWEGERRREWIFQVVHDAGTDADESRRIASIVPGLTVEETGSSVVISGTVRSVQDKTMLESFARTREKVHLRVSLPEEKKTLLSYDLKIIEISKGATAHLGVRWPDSLTVKGSWSRSSAESPSFLVASEIEAGLNLLMADGRAKILANPRLVCESGGSADFLAGGEIPIVIVTPETRAVEWKTYGIILKIHPEVDPDNRIRTQITAEISTVDHGSGGSEMPGFLTRRVTTRFTTPPGRTVMLSGLVKNEMAKDVAKVPLLGQIPILGELFKSRSFRENRSELAIFISPSEIRDDSGSEAAAWQARDARERNEMRFRLID